jgi:hypothetical protein
MKYRFRTKTFLVHFDDQSKNAKEIIEIPDGSHIIEVRGLPEGETKRLDKPNKIGNIFEVVNMKKEISYLEPYGD